MKMVKLALFGLLSGCALRTTPTTYYPWGVSYDRSAERAAEHQWALNNGPARTFEAREDARWYAEQERLKRERDGKIRAEQEAYWARIQLARQQGLCGGGATEQQCVDAIVIQDNVDRACALIRDREDAVNEHHNIVVNAHRFGVVSKRELLDAAQRVQETERELAEVKVTIRQRGRGFSVKECK